MLTAALTASAGLAIGAGVQQQFFHVSFHDPYTWRLAGTQSVTLFSGFAFGNLVAFQYSFDYGEPVSDSSWASDMQITVSTPNGSFTIGGYDNLPDFVPPYDGPASDDPGNYGADIDVSALGLGGAGMYTVTVTNDWSADPNPNTVSNFMGSFLMFVPTPGAVGLFGVAGLAAARRRR